MILIIAVAVGSRAVVLMMIGVLLKGVIGVALSSSMQGSVRTSGVHFLQTIFFHGKHGASLKE